MKNAIERRALGNLSAAPGTEKKLDSEYYLVGYGPTSGQP